MFINEEYIKKVLDDSKGASRDDVLKVLEKVKSKKNLSHQDVGILLQTEDKDLWDEIFSIAGEIKHSIYGNRIVMFAPLYISNYCVNECVYCGYRCSNNFNRKKLSMEEIREEVKVLTSMGHKRLAVEAGEDPVNCDIDYVVQSINEIYKTDSNIRRLNVNIASTTVENYKKLKDASIGTYILFQETYHQPTYERFHKKGYKKDYEYHLTAFDRAMQAGIEDVGAGVLFGLAEPKFEVLGLMLHNEHLEKEYGVGFHTISVPRLRTAEGVSINEYPDLLDDETFKKIVAIIRIAVPFTGIILSTRESADMRKELINYGVSQVSAGSCTGVGGYKDQDQESNDENRDKGQFEVADNRSPLEVLKGLIKDGHIPSYCTACYRKGRTGDRFMQLAKSGQIQNVCQPNAIMTLLEYIQDYGDDELKTIGMELINKEVEKIQREDVRNLVKENIEKLKNGVRDLYL